MNNKLSLPLISKRLVEIALPFFVIVISSFLTIRFLIPKILEMRKVHLELKKDETEVLSLEKKAGFLESQKSSITDQLEKITQVLPNEKDLPGLLVSLERLRQDSNISFKNMGFSPGLLATESAEIQSEKDFEFRINVLGAYDEIVDFIARLEKTAPLVTVSSSSVRFESSEEEGEEGERKQGAEMRLLFKTYNLPLVEEKLMVENPLPEFSSPLQETFDKMFEFKIFEYKSLLPDDKIGKENPFSIEIFEEETVEEEIPEENSEEKVSEETPEEVIPEKTLEEKSPEP